MTLSRQGQDIRILHEDQYIDMVRKRTLKHRVLFLTHYFKKMTLFLLETG